MIKAVIFDYDGVVKKSQKLSLDIADLYKISVEEYEKFIPQLKPIIDKKVLDGIFRCDGQGCAGKIWREG